MVSLKNVELSNSRLATSLPRLVAVFVGATSGIGETSLKRFAKHTRQPRAYFIGRSQKAGDRITAECKTLNADGEYIFIKADVSLICNVDNICQEIKSREKAINILFLTAGTLVTGTKTVEGVHTIVALAYYSRIRFILNLLPLLEQATALRRVVTVLAATKEGPIDTSDYQGLNVPLMSARGHVSSMITLSLEAIAKQAPSVSFIHDFPGSVRGNLVKEMKGVLPLVVRTVFWVLGPIVYIPTEESGERHVFLATSAKYPSAKTADAASGVPLVTGVEIARGTNGVAGSGVYSVDSQGESAGTKIEELLANFRRDGMVEQLWKHTEDEFKRIEALKT